RIMKIDTIKYSLGRKKARLSGQITLKGGKTHEIYFEVDTEYKSLIAKDASPFLAASLAIAMKKHEDLEIDGDLSTKLMANTSRIMKIIQSWGFGYSTISIHAKSLKIDLEKSQNIGCFFSGGVDSFYTFLRNKHKIDSLIFVHGFDISVKDKRLYRKVEKNIEKIARKEKVRLVKVKTNIREMFEQYFDWDMSHAFALASVSLFLSQGFKEIYMSCGQVDDNAAHQYMSPEIDALWSTENMKIHHFGCDAGKISKLRFLSGFPVVMQNLRVCWVNKGNAYNCGGCEKCLRNMLALYVVDSLEKCTTFKAGINLSKLESIRANKYVLQYFIAAHKALRKKNNQSDITLALEKCIRNNQFPSLKQRTFRDIRGFIRFIDNRYNSNRLYWYFTKANVI
ncbi:MAG: hypothetical protein Q8Q49_06215, partial [bacterium]|nr:hypothetical protein [bacterium]